MNKRQLMEQRMQVLYIDKRLSIKQVAQEIDSTSSTVHRHLRKLNIPIRTISEAQKGRVMSKESLEKRSKTRKRLYKEGVLNVSGKNNPMYGKHHSEETKEKYRQMFTLNLDHKKLKDLYYKNLNDVEIARHFGCSAAKIMKVRQELGLNSKHKLHTLNYKQKQNLEIYGIADDLKSMGDLRFGTNSKRKHELAKFTICFLLMKRGYDFLTEVKVESGTIDVYDFTNRIIYEVETNLNQKKKDDKYKQLFNKEKMSDFFIFGLKEVPDDNEGMYEYFKERVL